MRLRQVVAAVSVVLVVGLSPVVQATPALTVKPGSLGYSSILTTFDADLIEGRYEEVVTLTPTGATSGSFAYSFVWEAQNFVRNGSSVGCVGGFPNQCTGLGSSYSMFATLQGSGTYSLSAPFDPMNPAFQPDVVFTPDLGASISLKVAGAPLVLTAPVSGAGAWGVASGVAPQIELITGDVIVAEGELRPGVGTDFGSFGTITTADLTSPAGEAFFTGPRPFFDITLTAGNFNSYWLGQLGNTETTRTLGGQAQLTFANVPEPTSLALVGLALVASGVVAVRRRAS
jgi:PEP-CTERM motif